MTANVVNQVAYLKTSRNYPEDIKQFTVEVNKSYVDIANAVNCRTIGIFPTNRPAITGESWFLNGNLRQQTLRQVYNITSFASFNHGLDFTDISTFTVIRGIGYNGADYYPIPFANPAANSDLGVFVTPTQVVFVLGVGSPTIVRGFILLEWLSVP